jgi:hypothetical protein
LRLSERMQTFGESGDPPGVLDAEVPGLVRYLAETFTLGSRYAVAPDVAKP